MTLASLWLATVAGGVWIGRSISTEKGSISSTTTTPVIRVFSEEASGSPSRAVGPSAEPASAALDKSSLSLGVKLATNLAQPVEERLKAIFGLEDPVDRMEGWLALLKTLKTSEEMGAALGALTKDFDFRAQGREYAMLLNRWGALDPAAAIKMTSELKDGRARGMGTQQVMRDWAAKDPNAALAWGQANGPKEKKDGEGNWHLIGWVQSVAKTNPEWAAQVALSEPRSDARGEMMNSLLSGFITRDGEEGAKSWVVGLEDGVFKEGVTRRLASRLAETNPTQAATWVASLPEKSRPGAMSELIDRWADRDPNAAAQWLGQYPPSAETDDPRESLARRALRNDPESAMAWAGTITNERTRFRTIRDMVRDWRRRDEPAASAWLSRSGLPQEMVQKIVN